ncbi:hypothetical protein AaE_011053, partial [Aphanomyces astaci]
MVEEAAGMEKEAHGMEKDVKENKSDLVMCLKDNWMSIHTRKQHTEHYNKFHRGVEELTRRDLTGSLQGIGLDVFEGINTTTILLHVPRYFNYTEEKLRRMPVDHLKTIIEYKVLNFNAPVLSTSFAKAHSDFYDMVIKDIKEPPSRAMICRGQVETSIGELLGSYYLKEVWTADNAARVDSLELKVKAAFKTGLENTGWLDNSTLDHAKTKLSKLTHLLGGPKNPKTYPTLTFDPKAYIANLNKLSAFNTAFNIAQIDTTVDKQIWKTPAQDVNA